MNTRSKNQITAKRAAQRKRPTRIISLILSLSLISGNLTGFFSAAAELKHFCGKEAHTHTEECYRVYNTQDPTVTEETVVVEETVLETVPNETAESVEATTETVVETTAEAVVETTGEAVPEPAYTISETPVCGKEEHTHVVQCYSNPDEDVETAANWEATLPETLTGTWADDLLAVAKNQVGYSESKKNYIVEADGETISGYNRYGAWYASVGGGDSYAYAPWNVTFLFFDLYHAGINFTDFPYEETCPEWIAALNSCELYRAAGEYTPAEGDLVFVDTDGDGEADRVGVASEVEDNKLIAIEGDYEGAVAEVTYDLPELTVEPETTETEGTTEIDVSVSQSSVMLLSDGTDEGDEAPQPTVVGYGDTNEAQAQVEVSGGEDAPVLMAWTAGSSKLYLNINGTTWDEASAQFRLWYATTDGNDWDYSDPMTKVSDVDDLYVIDLPGDINTNSEFMFVRLNPAATVDKENWVGDNNTWGKTGNIKLSDAGDSNTYKLTNYNDGISDGKWEGNNNDSGSGGETGGDTPADACRIYFDASLSKLDYTGSVETNYSIPSTSGTIRYYATGSGVSDKEGNMTKVSSHTSGGNTWSDVYYVDLPAGYSYIAFSAFDMTSITNYGGHGESTTKLTIPTNLENPCFYAD